MKMDICKVIGHQRVELKTTKSIRTMRYAIKVVLISASVLSVIPACDTQQKKEGKEAKKEQPVNPNGDSELAILMREMADEAESIKIQIEKGERPEVRVDYHEILTATATEPEKKASPVYEAFAESHIQSMQLLEDADTSRMLSLYDNMVNNCINCHKELCPGPLVRIKKLKVKKETLQKI